MSDRMGSAQAGRIAASLKKIHDEVTHWQAAHPDAEDSMVMSLEYFLRHAQNAARIMDETRRVETGA